MRSSILCSVLLAGIFWQPTIAAECPQLGKDPTLAYQRAEAVFVGRVVKVKQLDDAIEVGFEVKEPFKGVKTDELLVFTQGTPTYIVIPGHYPFIEGESYLVFAGSVLTGDLKGKLWVGGCGRTTKLEYAAADLEIIRRAR